MVCTNVAIWVLWLGCYSPLPGPTSHEYHPGPALVPPFGMWHIGARGSSTSWTGQLVHCLVHCLVHPVGITTGYYLSSPLHTSTRFSAFTTLRHVLSAAKGMRWAALAPLPSLAPYCPWCPCCPCHLCPPTAGHAALCYPCLRSPQTWLCARALCSTHHHLLG